MEQSQSETTKRILAIIGISLATTIVVLVILAGIVYANRANIAGYIHPAETPLSLAEAHDQVVIAAVQKANPAVVSIIITKEVPVMKEYIENEQIPDPFDMFGGGDGSGGFSIQVPEYQQDGTQEQEVGGGSGFFVSSNGLIVTNDHVVNDSSADYTVYTNDGKSHPAKVVAQDAADDVAVVQITGTGYPYLTFDTSDALQLGQSVIAIGNALGEFRNTVSVGVVSGLARSITAGDEATGGTENLSQVIQTDAAINPGNSGGPLLDLLGNVVGMNSAVAEGSQSIGFALPGNIVNQAVQSVIAHGKIEFPYIGLRYVPITDAVEQQEKLSVDYGDLVMAGPDATDTPAVVPGSPAAKAGIVTGDIILQLDGTSLTSTSTSLTDLVRAKNVGDAVTLLVLHNGKQETITVTLAEDVEQ